MPTLEASKKDLEALIGIRIKNREELEELLMFAKAELDGMDGDALKIDEKDTNRPDLWSIEGIAREIKAKIGKERGLRKYKVSKARTKCVIDKTVEKTRPFIACAIARNVKVTSDLLIQIIQLQEKVAATYGRRRKEAAIGIYDYGIMTPPIHYKGFKDNEIEFVPLEYKVKMKPSEILSEHPKGKEFGNLLAGTEYYPIVIDSKGIVASMPPVINSRETGKVTENTKNLFIEATGFSHKACETAVKVICMALADRGADIEQVEIVYPKTTAYPKKNALTPTFGAKKIVIESSLINSLTGLSLNEKEMIALLEKSGMNAKASKGKITAEYPDYRIDIMHKVDIIEDLLVGYGYNKIAALPINMNVRGAEDPFERKKNALAEACVGMGLQEIITFTLTSKEKQGEKILCNLDGTVEIKNPMSLNWCILRKNIFPEMLEFLAKNKDAEYPQKIFEIGKTVEAWGNTDTGVAEKNKLSISLCGAGNNYTSIKSVLESLEEKTGLKYELKESSLPFLEEGKAADISLNGKKIGFIGEAGEKTLANFSIRQPVAMLEIEI